MKALPPQDEQRCRLSEGGRPEKQTVSPAMTTLIMAHNYEGGILDIGRVSEAEEIRCENRHLKGNPRADFDETKPAAAASGLVTEKGQHRPKRCTHNGSHDHRDAISPQTRHRRQPQQLRYRSPPPSLAAAVPAVVVAAAQQRRRPPPPRPWAPAGFFPRRPVIHRRRFPCRAPFSPSGLHKHNPLPPELRTSPMGSLQPIGPNFAESTDAKPVATANPWHSTDTRKVVIPVGAMPKQILSRSIRNHSHGNR